MLKNVAILVTQEAAGQSHLLLEILRNVLPSNSPLPNSRNLPVPAIILSSEKVS